MIQSRGKTEQNQIAEMNKRIAEAKKKVGIPQRAQCRGRGETRSGTMTSVTQEDVNQLMNEKIQLEMQYESTKSEIASAQEQYQ